MSRYAPNQIDAYADGLTAARREGKYAGATDVVPCPHRETSPLHQPWWDGFGDGTEDMIAYQRSFE